MDIKDQYSRIFLQESGKDFSADSIKKIRPIIWFNTRKNKGGLRLTDKGLQLVKECEIKTYKVNLPPDFALTPQIIVWIDHYIDSPFYITKKYIIVLKEKVAFELFLFSGDVRKLGYNRALSKAMDRNSSSKN